MAIPDPPAGRQTLAGVLASLVQTDCPLRGSFRMTPGRAQRGPRRRCAAPSEEQRKA